MGAGQFQTRLRVTFVADRIPLQIHHSALEQFLAQRLEPGVEARVFLAEAETELVESLVEIAGILVSPEALSLLLFGILFCQPLLLFGAVALALYLRCLFRRLLLLGFRT